MKRYLAAGAAVFALLLSGCSSEAPEEAPATGAAPVVAEAPVVEEAADPMTTVDEPTGPLDMNPATQNCAASLARQAGIDSASAYGTCIDLVMKTLDSCVESGLSEGLADEERAMRIQCTAALTPSDPSYLGDTFVDETLVAPIIPYL